MRTAYWIGLLVAGMSIIPVVKGAEPDSACYHALENPEAAIPACEALIHQNPQDAVAYDNLGVAHKAKGHLNRAFNAYRQAIAIDPNNAKAFYHLGLAYEDKHQDQQALEAFRKSNDLQTNRDAQTEIAKCEQNLKKALSSACQNFDNPDVPIPVCEKLIRQDPNDAVAYDNLGNAYDNQGKTDKAIDAYLKAIDIDTTI